MKTIVKPAILVAVILLINSNASGQNSRGSPTPEKQEIVAANTTPDENALKSEAPVPTQTPAPAPTPKPDFWHWEKMTGDWGGDRERLKSKGVEMDFTFSQFYQGVASGGLRTSSEYNAIFETAFKLDFGKMKPSLKWWSMEVHSETRFGGPVVGGTGAINPVNLAALLPASDGTAVSVTSLFFTRLIPKNLAKGDLFAVSFGRFNIVDLIDEDLFAGKGTERFFNVAQTAPLTASRQVPLITNGAIFAYIKAGEPRFTFLLLDPNDHSLDPGLKDLFADGVTLSPTFIFPAKHFGKSARHSVGGAITTKKYTPFDDIRVINLPGPPRTPVEPKRGSWSISYAFRNYIVERGPKDGWGFFTQASISDPDTSPISTFLNLGLGGNGLFKSRPTDEFGVAYAYTDLSDVLKDNLNLINLAGRRPRAEHQFEAFYNVHFTPWLRLTGDLQIIRPTRVTADTAIIPGARLVMIF